MVRTALLLLLACATPHAQPADVSIRATLDVRLHWIQLEYGEPFVDGEAVLLRGEPIDLELLVSNSDRSGPDVTAVEADWQRRISIRIRTGGRDSTHAFRPVSCTFLTTARTGSKVVQRADMLWLSRGAQVNEVCRLQLRPDELSAGAHTLHVDWSDAADMVRFRKVIPQELPRSLQFEYRDVATDADRLDLWIHLARRAFDDGRIDEAAAHVERVLRVEPLATSGLILRGKTKLAKGDCRAATQDWMLAANVLENNADVLNKWQASRRRMIDGNPEHAAANLRARVNRLSCK